MEIKYLTLLRDNPSHEPEGIDRRMYNDPMTISEIAYLEQKYNGEKKFPQALRELLFLCGNGSFLIDVIYGPPDEETPNPQEEQNDEIREDLLEFNNNVMPITRPFYIIGGGSGSGIFEFVYLDEGEDPAVYQSVYNYSEQTRDWEGIGNTKGFDSITKMVEIRIVNLLKSNGVPIVRN